MADPPIFINCRDRVSDLRQLVGWLERAGHERITLIDNDSSYPELLDYLEQSPHDVWRGPNRGARALWIADIVPDDEPFVYTDPDVLPVDECPMDAVAHLAEVLARHPQVLKVGLGLFTADVPESVRSLSWERGPVINGPFVEPGVRQSLVDTTLAVYRAGAPFGLVGLRTTWPYVARHLPWYHLDAPSSEERYYLDHAIRGQYGSSWAGGTQ